MAMWHSEGSGRVVGTGPDARWPEVWDDRPSVGKLEASGRWDLAALAPAIEAAVHWVVQDRMQRFPCATDGVVPIRAVPSSSERHQRDGGTVVMKVRRAPTASPAPNAIAIYADALTGPALDRLLRAATHASGTGELFPTSLPLLSGIRHEAVHPLVELMLTSPLVRAELERRIALAVGDPGLQLGAEPSEHASNVAQLGRYGGGAFPHRSEPASLERVVREQGAEALAMAMEHGDDAPPVAKAWLSVAEVCFAPSSPVAKAWNEHRYRQLHLNHWIRREAPFVVADSAHRLIERWRYAWKLAPELAADPDLAWERANPAVPEVVLDYLAHQHPDVPPAELRTMALEGRSFPAAQPDIARPTELVELELPVPDGLEDALRAAFVAHPFDLAAVAGRSVYSGARFSRDRSGRLLNEPGDAGWDQWRERPEHLPHVPPKSTSEEREAVAMIVGAADDAMRTESARAGLEGRPSIAAAAATARRRARQVVDGIVTGQASSRRGSTSGASTDGPGSATTPVDRSTTAKGRSRIGRYARRGRGGAGGGLGAGG